jgi:hypothetical protein
LFTNYNTICKQKKGIKTIIVKNKNIYTIDDDNNFWKDNTLIEVLNPSKTLFYNFRTIYRVVFWESTIKYKN